MSVLSARPVKVAALAAGAALALVTAFAGTSSAATGEQAAPRAQACSIAGLGDPHTCAQAVTWAKNHITTAYHADYYRACDHLVGLAYGFPHSGSTTAQAHWNAIPGGYKHAGDRSVPAGGLAFFSTSSAGHVMISIGSGQFVSNDIHGNGTYTKTTIAEIENSWGAHYLGWAQPWFQYNH
jgi:hypothetical protein